ncbi:hypothetical protein WR25_15967 [Diploscapter pachys]|uniref:Uncharacterized protein n=1 Tax=Diploscapter pachys TaxID=2018661 RepID=A0A2A2M4P2_9BILA|nr:hypothetical protein WR25_15967 [Diploscapter pachys]
MAMASTPAVGPRPTARTNNSAQTISGTLRRKISRPRTGRRAARDHGPRRPALEAARKDNARLASRLAGTASSSARLMPAVATARVCTVAVSSKSRNPASWAGGQNALTKPAICWRFSACNSTPGSSSLRRRPGHSNARHNRVNSTRGMAAGSRWSVLSIAGSAPAGWPSRQQARPVARWRTRHRASLR